MGSIRGSWHVRFGLEDEGSNGWKMQAPNFIDGKEEDDIKIDAPGEARAP